MIRKKKKIRKLVNILIKFQINYKFPKKKQMINNKINNIHKKKLK